jgi:hypothetical protein
MADGTQAVAKITKKVEVDGKFFEPLNPCPYPYTSLLDEIPDSVNSVDFGFASESQTMADNSKTEIEGH